MMKNNEKNDNGLINKVRETEPELDKPGELTENVMNRLKVRQTGRPKLKKLIVVLRPAMSAAALWLIGLFVFQYFDASVTHDKPKNYIYSFTEKKPGLNKTDNLQTYKQLVNKTNHCKEQINKSFDQLDRQCLISLAAEYQEQKQLNNKRIENIIQYWQKIN